MVTYEKIVKILAKNVEIIEEFGNDGKRYIEFTCGGHSCYNKIEEYEIKHKTKENGIENGKIRCHVCKTYNIISY